MDYLTHTLTAAFTFLGTMLLPRFLRTKDKESDQYMMMFQTLTAQLAETRLNAATEITTLRTEFNIIKRELKDSQKAFQELFVVHVKLQGDYDRLKADYDELKKEMGARLIKVEEALPANA